MAKTETSLGKMVMTLFVISLLASASVGFIYELTKEPIFRAQEAKKKVALKRVLPAFDNTPSEEMTGLYVDGDTLYIYTARESNTITGYAVETFTNEAFGGKMRLMVGFLPDGTIKEVSVLDHKETPGLGDKISKSKSDWSVQFEGKNPADYKMAVRKEGGDVDAITASTITSRAYCDALQRAYDAITKGGQQHE